MKCSSSCNPKVSTQFNCSGHHGSLLTLQKPSYRAAVSSMIFSARASRRMLTSALGLNDRNQERRTSLSGRSMPFAWGARPRRLSRSVVGRSATSSCRSTEICERRRPGQLEIQRRVWWSVTHRAEKLPKVFGKRCYK